MVNSCYQSSERIFSLDAHYENWLKEQLLGLENTTLLSSQPDKGQIYTNTSVVENIEIATSFHISQC